ncbi:hypothetical protein F5X68DRAFT_231814 [Plectosphaerella plurivora]|uniref:Uncharacterized protein n=1 Tax=Plectosphaerella plurivora TaxID=936078 RepID=A0A9P9AB27_9PEZI|nr:hypothetical protein F5X68DRAFT_231814 [Plectosphaerella plurivora]
MSAYKIYPAGSRGDEGEEPLFPEQIWEDAIVGYNTPRIHYYSLFNTDDQGLGHSGLRTARGIINKKKPSTLTAIDNKGIAESSENSDVLDWSIQTSNSLQRRPRNTKWTRANRFHYYWTSGLLTACSESRFIFLRRYKKLFSGHEKLTIAKGYDGKKEVQMHFNALQDIICLCFCPEDIKAAVAGLQWDVLLASMPFFPSDPIDVVNIAFEFDSTWNDNIPDLWSDLAEMQPKIFIDHNLKYVECKEWRDDSPEFAASAGRFVWQLKKWYDELRAWQTHFDETSVASSWRLLPWNSRFCVAALRMVPAGQKLRDMYFR